MSVSKISETINNVLATTGIDSTSAVHYQLTAAQLSESTISLGQGKLNDKVLSPR